MNFLPKQSPFPRSPCYHESTRNKSALERAGIAYMNHFWLTFFFQGTSSLVHRQSINFFSITTPFQSQQLLLSHRLHLAYWLEWHWDKFSQLVRWFPSSLAWGHPYCSLWATNRLDHSCAHTEGGARNYYALISEVVPCHICTWWLKCCEHGKHTGGKHGLKVE